MDSADLKGAFRELTGERAEEFLEMAGKPENEPSLRMLLHFTILEANKSGQTGQTLATSETTTTTATTESSQTDEEEDRPSSSKKRKSSDDLEKKITMLEEGQDSVESLKEKMRMLCLQANPNDALILLALDDLARAARKKQHSEMDTYGELVRQAHKHQHAVNIASLALGVVGGKAVDVVVKVLNKCVKEKQVESKLNSNSQETEAKKNENLNYNSPMFNAYPNYPMPPMPMWQTPGYGMQKNQAFILPQDKKEIFILLRENLLCSESVDIKTLQRFAGKCISMALAVPAAKLYCRVLNSAISWCMKNSRNIPMSENLKNEIMYWKFLDEWEGHVSWRRESHKQIVLASDASLFKYGAAILSGDQRGMLFGDFWDDNDKRPIHLKEAEAVLKVLQSLGDKIRNHRVDLYTDNKAVICSWENQGGRDCALNDLMKDIFRSVVKLNEHLTLHYVTSGDNKADEPSRSLNMTDSMLSKTAWAYVQQIFGLHSVDLMALDSNSMKDCFGCTLRHFTPFPTPYTAGVNVFAQDLSNVENPYKNWGCSSFDKRGSIKSKAPEDGEKAALQIFRHKEAKSCQVCSLWVDEDQLVTLQNFAKYVCWAKPRVSYLFTAASGQELSSSSTASKALKSECNKYKTATNQEHLPRISGTSTAREKGCSRQEQELLAMQMSQSCHCHKILRSIT
ncbi:hypothetical protein FSP39_010584 [Pinctada imbricata]|uniref:Uncharacterized protein n=1 Tax=Pinctada imbricata TaxID=66713 RepID=A0AA88YTC8_PINIB|nr:hypothetical protein FSP39_010584 [Pinctada imbricata]